MPSVIIKEYDNTKAGVSEYKNFTVVVPGFVKNESGVEAYFDENGICECDTIKKLEKVIDKNLNEYQIGNQIAYLLISLGYTVLYKGLLPESSEKPLDLLIKDSFWTPLKDKSIYDFRYIISGLIKNCNTKKYITSADVTFDKVNKCMAKIATYNNKQPEDTGRGDCIALLDLDEANFSGKVQHDVIRNIIGQVKNYESNDGVDKYSAFITPQVTYTKESLGTDLLEFKLTSGGEGNRTFPASIHYLVCAAKAFDNYPEWFAVAGFDRGSSDFEVEGTSVKFGEIAVNTLGPRKHELEEDVTKSVNVVANIRGDYYIWGNRTARDLDDEGLIASHFLNIRQLCCTLKKELYVICKNFTFDPNSDVLWINFTTKVKAILEKMKANQGIKDYKIIKCVSETKASLTAKIRIVPIEAVEDFDIGVYLEDSVSGITVEFNE